MQENKSEDTPSRQQPCPETSRWVRFLEIIFGGIAKATMVVVGVVGFVFFFPESLTTLPTTKKELMFVLLLIALSAIATGLLWYFHVLPV